MLTRRLIPGLCLVILTSVILTAAAIDAPVANAVMNGDRDAVRSLLKQKANVNAAQGDGMTALHWAAFRDDLEIAQLLVQSGANVKAVTRNGALTPIFMLNVKTRSRYSRRSTNTTSALCLIFWNA